MFPPVYTDIIHRSRGAVYGGGGLLFQYKYLSWHLCPEFAGIVICVHVNT